MNESVQVGSKVELKSGSKRMTVVEIKEEVATCKWWSDSDDEFKKEVFPVSVLTSDVD